MKSIPDGETFKRAKELIINHTRNKNFTTDYIWGFHGDKIKCIKKSERPGLEEGGQYRFSGMFNVVRQHGSKSAPIVNENEIREWFSERFSKNGAKVFISSLQTDVVKIPRKEKFDLTVSCTCVEGTFTINNWKEFERIYRHGVGKEKSYGFGMILIKNE
jgi:hypothetical protein